MRGMHRTQSQYVIQNTSLMHVAERTHRKLIKHEEVGDKRAPTARSKTKELILYSFIHEYKEKYKKIITIITLVSRFLGLHIIMPCFLDCSFLGNREKWLFGTVPASFFHVKSMNFHLTMCFNICWKKHWRFYYSWHRRAQRTHQCKLTL